MDKPPQNSAPKRRWPKWAKAFLSSLGSQGVVGFAAKAAKIDRTTAYNLRTADTEFRAAWETALDEAIDVAEKEAWRRAVKGCKKPVYQGGLKVGFIQEYSDTLLIFMLKSHRPNKYRERYDVRHGGAGGGPIQINHGNIDPAAFAAFANDVLAAGGPDLRPDGAAQSLPAPGPDA